MIISLKFASYAVLASFRVCELTLLTHRWYKQSTLDGRQGVQKIHVTAAPRIGGLGLMVGVLTG